MMAQRTWAIVYWPGMSTDIRHTREGCAECNRHAPAQAVTPPLPATPPSTLFEAVFADFFTFGGRHYLVVGDRLSAGSRFLDPPQAQLSQALPASFTTSVPSSPRLVYRKNFPVMVAQNSVPVVQRLSSVSGEYDIACPRPTSLSLMAEQRWQ